MDAAFFVPVAGYRMDRNYRLRRTESWPTHSLPTTHSDLGL